MPNIRFIKYLIKTLALQTDFAKYGRIQVFAIMYPRDFTVSSAKITKVFILNHKSFRY